MKKSEMLLLKKKKNRWFFWMYSGSEHKSQDFFSRPIVSQVLQCPCTSLHSLVVGPIIVLRVVCTLEIV